MRIHDTFGNKTLATNHTHVRSFTRVSSLVDPKWRPLGETLAAVFTYEGLLAGMNPFMLLELFFPGKALRAHLASVRFVTSMDSKMELQLFFVRQSFATDITQYRGINALGIMLAQVVPFQSSRRCVVLITNGAIVFDKRTTCHYLPMLRASMRSQEPRKHEMFPTDLALKRLFSGVEIFMFDGVGTDSKGLIANLAFVLGSTFVGSDVHFYVVLGSVLVVTKVASEFVILAVLDRMQGEVNIILKRNIARITMYRFV